MEEEEDDKITKQGSKRIPANLEPFSQGFAAHDMDSKKETAVKEDYYYLCVNSVLMPILFCTDDWQI